MLGDYSISSDSLSVSQCIPTKEFLPTEIRSRIILRIFVVIDFFRLKTMHLRSSSFLEFVVLNEHSEQQYGAILSSGASKPEMLLWDVDVGKTHSICIVDVKSLS